MRTNELSPGGPAFSVLGLGTWAFGGDGWAGSWGPQSTADAGAALRTAIEHGVNWVDTAPAYGLGRAESLIGELLPAELADQVFIATKCGERIGDGGTYKSGAPRGITADCDASLSRLRREVIDLLQLHHPPPDVPIEESWSAMADLVKQGKVRHIGLCNPKTVSDLRRCHEIRPIETCQLSYSLLRRGAEEELLPYCRTEGIAVHSYGSLGHGFLTDNFVVDRLAVDDWRRRDRWSDEITRGRVVHSVLRDMAAEYGVSVVAVCIAWVLDHPAIAATPVGARSARQAAESFAAIELPGIRARMEEIVEERSIDL